MNAIDRSRHTEQPARYPLEDSKYWLAVLLGLLGAVVYIGLGRFFGAAGTRQITDFDVFHLVGQFVNRGEVGKTYYFRIFGPAQAELNGSPIFMPWTYPPPFNLVVAPLSHLPLGWAYTLFTVGTLFAYLLVLRKIAGRGLALLLAISFPAIAVTIACGQNGFLTASLVGAASIILMSREAAAGVPLGLLIIKPHLAVPFAVTLLARRNWSTIIVGALTVALVSALTTAVLGFEVWGNFLNAVRESKIFLSDGYYPQHRMISIYATLRSLGAPLETAAIAQAATAAVVIGLTLLASGRGYTIRQSCGVAACGAVLVSPYAYDYDLHIYTIGLALLLPEISGRGSAVQRALLYALTFATGAFGIVQSRMSYDFENAKPWTLAGFTLVICFLLVCRMVARCKGEAQVKLTV